MPQAGLEGSNTIQQSPQYAALSDYISNKIELNGALDKFSSPAENEWTSSTSAEEVEEQLTLSWRSIISQAAQTSFKDAAQQKLADFVVGLQQRPALQKDGQTCQVQGTIVWKDLPTFGWSIRDAWNQAAGPDSDQKSKDQWINLNAFTALLTASAHSKTNDNPDLSLFGFWALRQAFEEQNVSDVAIAAAAAWFVYAAPTIYDFSQKSKSFDGKVAKPGSAFSDQSWTGFSQDRWQVWTKKLSELQGRVSNNTASQLVEQAQVAIGEIQQ
ncbi:hypothetical protein M409DRAFT_71062 [Zasmidium cellare ATCC 36951]|uniref:Uncharacterized protein n=1 Tax=Zasmidium cellare ATCC 36951 TaxID=1080233 RepID=A0A6A6BXH7_ZASCE|nr:uncharacterized protein M409DRAFT_71062 [Zasmidium cellare ATCC 36951]KAF2159395.1 hypothetical protein M409DRAFT_71062 [Zasmidium cellare ATCC 36951]